MTLVKSIPEVGASLFQIDQSIIALGLERTITSGEKERFKVKRADQINERF